MPDEAIRQEWAPDPSIQDRQKCATGHSQADWYEPAFNTHLRDFAHQHGAVSTDPYHLHSYKVHRLEGRIDGILQQAGLLGTENDAWYRAVMRIG